MIPILFSKDSTTFTTNGLGALANCISCKVTEKRNGEYVLSMQYPLDGIHYSDIKNDCIIWAKPSDGANNQAFRIYKIKKPLNGIVTIEAEHISYQLSSIPTMPFTAQTAITALNGLKTNAAEACPFFFYTDKQTQATYNQEQPASIRSRLGGVEGSILDVYGGEYEFDNYDVHLWASRGSDKGVTLRYGKNITDLSQEENIQNVITGVCPFWANEDTVVVLPEKVVESEYASLYPYPRTKVLDLSTEWTETAPTVAQLRARAQQYIEDNDIGIPKISIDVSFIALWQTEEYKNIAPLERVNLCDTITVLFEKLGIEAKAKVITTEYDVLHERYNKIEIGDAKSSLASTIVEIDATTNQKIEVVKNYTDKAIVHATDLITGGLGGYVYLKPNANGYPEEILIMDSPDIDTAVNIWRWNKNGLGFSSNGYGGPYGTAITSDGQIVADYITAGVLSGGLLQVGTVSAEALSAQAKAELSVIHEYVASDVLDSITNWSWRPVAEGTVSIVQIDGENCLALDGTGLSVFDTAYYGQTKIDLMGKQSLKISFKFRFSDDITIAQEEKSFFVYYHGLETSSYRTYTDTYDGTFNKDTWYQAEYSWDMGYTSNILKYTPEFGIYSAPGVIRYIKDINITSTVDGYATSSLDFAVDGINMAFEEAQGTHDYCPYDLMSNISRWYGKAGFPPISFETISGKTYVKIDADGITSVTNDHIAQFDSDYIGKPQLRVSFKLRFNKQYTCLAGERFFNLDYVDSSGNTSQEWRYWTNSRSFDADNDYSYSFTISPSVDSIRSQRLGFYFHPDVITYVTDIVVTSTEDAYNSACLKVSSKGLSSVVQNANLISTINQSAEAVTISANKLNLTGDLSLRGDFTSYNPNDNLKYCFLDSGNIAFYSGGVNVFTISSQAILGQYAGIFFGDTEDPSAMADYTYIEQNMVSTPMAYCKSDGKFETLSEPPTSYTLISENMTRLHYLYANFIYAYDQSAFYAAVRFEGNVYNSAGGVQFVSDKRKKRSIKDLAIEKARSFIMALRPVKYKFLKNVSTSNRYHHGFIAQDVKEAMPEDWGIYCENKEDDFIGLRYDEFIADMVAMIQDHEKRISELEGKGANK